MASEPAAPETPTPLPQPEPLTLASMPPDARVAAFESELRALCLKYRVAVVPESYIAIHAVE